MAAGMVRLYRLVGSEFEPTDLVFGVVFYELGYFNKNAGN